jgi:hypothetical protein
MSETSATRPVQLADVTHGASRTFNAVQEVTLFAVPFDPVFERLFLVNELFRHGPKLFFRPAYLGQFTALMMRMQPRPFYHSFGCRRRVASEGGGRSFEIWRCRPRRFGGRARVL